MNELEERVAAAHREQLRALRAALDAGAQRVGWKIGLNLAGAQRLLGAQEPVVGHLTSLTRLESGAAYSAGDARELRAEAEVAVEVGEAGGIAGYAAAIELVDVGRPPSDLEAIIAANVFHRAFVLGPTGPEPPATARLSVGDAVHEPDRPADDHEALLAVAAHHLATAGERLRPGDRVITGSVIHVPVGPGDEIRLEMGVLGRLSVAISA